MQGFSHNAAMEIVAKQDLVITERLNDEGIFLLTDAIRERLLWISNVGDIYNHLFLDYGTEKEKRIISITKDPVIEWKTDKETGACSVTVSYSIH